jgi:hypothetical protein
LETVETGPSAGDSLAVTTEGADSSSSYKIAFLMCRNCFSNFRCRDVGKAEELRIAEPSFLSTTRQLGLAKLKLLLEVVPCSVYVIPDKHKDSHHQACAKLGDSRKHFE